MRMHRSARPASPSENRSVRAARVRATLHMLHTQGLSRSPPTVPINTEAADQTCWSAACAYARRRQRRPYLVGGVSRHLGPKDLGAAIRAGRQPCMRSTSSTSARRRDSPQKPVRPRPSGPVPDACHHHSTTPVQPSPVAGQQVLQVVVVSLSPSHCRLRAYGVEPGQSNDQANSTFELGGLEAYRAVVSLG